MAKAAGAREKIKMTSTVSEYFYTTYKNRRNTTEKLELVKYDPIVRKRVLFKEGRIK
ncbi:MAG: 50S ribosomal protein L33 [Planctomycetota bacterium]|nr:50S ribosomal protein L33 [Planctomycetota bacterium]